ncbi:MAG: hypothetical protein IRY96_05205 [Burkholderiales bacterium]|nr:hypothetical protein [Burkholderiales bacterium]
MSGSLVSTLGLRLRSSTDSALQEPDYVLAGQRRNDVDLREAIDEKLFYLYRTEESFAWVAEVPFAFKQLIDLHAAMRHAVAVAGEQTQRTAHPLFHAVFGAFALGFAQGLVTAHRRKHLRWHGYSGDLTRLQQEQCDQWGVEIATYYLAAVEAQGIFSKTTDAELYGITDKWWTLGDGERVESIPGIRECVQRARHTAEHWSDDDTVDVAMQFGTALERVIKSAR